MHRTLFNRLFYLILLCLLSVVACRAKVPTATTCAEAPAFERTAVRLAACLGPDAQASEVTGILERWGRVGSKWGAVTEVNLLPGGEPELVLRYHADLKNANWDPQGKLVILGRANTGWHVAFDASTLQISTAKGEVWDNWRYDLLETADLTGDGLQDLFVELVYSNGLRAVWSYAVLLTAHPGEDDSVLRAAFLRETTLTRPTYQLMDRGGQKSVEAVIKDNIGNRLITQTYGFDEETLVLTEETINPDANTTFATTPDGASWYGFDDFDGGGGSPPYSPHLGLYRVQGDQLAHFSVPGPIRALEAAPDGRLYVGAGCGVLRYDGVNWETLLRITCDAQQPSRVERLIPLDLAVAENGDVWVGGNFRMARFDGQAWHAYDVNARRILIAPDGSVWTAGWDGRADSECCFTHVTGDGWVTYDYSAELPVGAELRAEIEMLRH